MVPTDSGSAATQPSHRFGLVSLACLVVANMIGAGVYTSSGFALGDLKTRPRVLLAWCTAGAIAMIGSLCYGRLARRITASGGEYLFLSRAVHPLAGFMAGWISLTAGFSGAIAYAAITFDVYLPASSYLASLPDGVVPAALILTFGILHLIGFSYGTRIQNWLVAFKLAILVSFTIFGLFQISANNNAAITVPVWQELTAIDASLNADLDPNAAQETGFPFSAFATSVMWLSFSFAGYNAAVYVAGAATSGSVVARSMWLATVIVAIIYLLLNTVILYSVLPEELAGQKEVLKIAAAAVGGSTIQGAISIVILLSLATSVSAMLQAGPHVYAQMAKDGLLPRSLGGEQAGVPRAATVLQIVLAVVLAVFADLQSLLDYLSFLLTLSSAATVAILIFTRGTGEEAKNSGWLSSILPIMFVVASLVISALSLRFRLSTDPRGLGLALLIVPLGLLAYWIFRLLGQMSRNVARPPL